jgi:hypothetical protein
MFELIFEAIRGKREREKALEDGNTERGSRQTGGRCQWNGVRGRIVGGTQLDMLPFILTPDSRFIKHENTCKYYFPN